MDSHQAEWLFAAQPLSVPQARKLIAHTLRDLPEEALEVVLLLSTELVTNAVQHGAHPVNVHVGWDAEGVRVEVTDPAPERPIVQAMDLDALKGRGLILVDGLSSDWGVQKGNPGKTVWFALHTPPDPGKLAR